MLRVGLPVGALSPFMEDAVLIVREELDAITHEKNPDGR